MIRNPKRLVIASVATALFSLNTHAVPIAIVDSGTDLSHPDLQNVSWTNEKDPDDAVDNDDNGYVDDTHGWNFAERNNKLFDKRLVGKYSKDVYTFFEYQTKSLKGTGTPEEKQWMKDHIADENFLAQLESFGGFVHGTHVAGISSKNSAKAEIMPIKLIPTKAPPATLALIASNPYIASAADAGGDEAKMKLLIVGVTLLGQQQAKAFAPIGAYVKAEGARVANCSFGTSVPAVKGLLGPIAEKVLGRAPTEAEMNAIASAMVNAAMTATKTSFTDASPNTLFVIAAGNDGTSNDDLPASPANIRADNTITVAATNDSSSLAVFSNYGVKNVDVAAPGVGIRSCAPGNEFVELSGTSQATPFVTNVAGQIFDANNALKPAQVKAILMGTTDQKSFLQGKTVTGGMVNSPRAVTAAKYTLTMSVADAITKATREVKDQSVERFLGIRSVRADRDVFVAPLPNPLF